MNLKKTINFFAAGVVLAFVLSFSFSFQSNILTFISVTFFSFLTGYIYGNNKEYSLFIKALFLSLPFISINIINFHWDSIINIGSLFVSLILGLGTRANWKAYKKICSAFIFIWVMLILLISLYIMPYFRFYEFTERINNNEKNIEFMITSSSGDTVESSQLRERVVLIDFWDSYCGACFRQFPNIQKIYEKYKHNPRVFICVLNTGTDTYDKMKSVISKIPYTFPVFYDNESKLTDKLGIQSIPQIYLIDYNGNIRFIHKGYSKDESLSFEGMMTNEIEKLLKDVPP